MLFHITYFVYIINYVAKARQSDSLLLPMHFGESISYPFMIFKASKYHIAITDYNNEATKPGSWARVITHFKSKIS